MKQSILYIKKGHKYIFYWWKYKDSAPTGLPSLHLFRNDVFVPKITNKNLYIYLMAAISQLRKIRIIFRNFRYELEISKLEND